MPLQPHARGADWRSAATSDARKEISAIGLNAHVYHQIGVAVARPVYEVNGRDHSRARPGRIRTFGRGNQGVPRIAVPAARWKMTTESRRVVMLDGVPQCGHWICLRTATIRDHRGSQRRTGKWATRQGSSFCAADQGVPPASRQSQKEGRPAHEPVNSHGGTLAGFCLPCKEPVATHRFCP